MEDSASMMSHNMFSTQEADITIRSSDGMIFKLHRSNLAAHTGAFPGTELQLDSHGESVTLTEPGNVLEIVFQFVYPRKHPKLNKLDFKLLMSVAEAVEKYEVFSAMNISEVRLGEALPQHAAEILVHAIKHDYPELIDKAAVHISRTQILDFINILPPHSVTPLLEYQGVWQKIFDDSITSVKKLKLTFGSGCQSDVIICRTCAFSLLSWITNLTQIKAISELKDAIETPTANFLLNNPDLANQWCSHCQRLPNSCYHVSSSRKIFQNGMASIPPFTEFLKAKEPCPSQG